MYKVKFTDFRAFGNASAMEVRPITLLIGENSAGKTSFLAGLRFLLESFSRAAQNPFNRDPYFLGGFEQIAHYRGGRGGRAKTFSLSLEVPATSKSEHTHARRGGINVWRHTFEFAKGYPQPVLNEYLFETNDAKLNVVLKGNSVDVTLQSNGKPAQPFLQENARLPPSAIVRNNPAFLRYVIDDIRIRWRAAKDDPKRSKMFDQIGLTKAQMESVFSAFRDSSQVLSQEVFASAPVRTQPLRTYNPSEVVTSSEGSHVPLELARTKQRSTEDWSVTKAALEVFGKNAGLFSDIEVRQLGKSDIDPFQVLVKINGPAMNLVDVGYGVSQVLPIVYQMQNTQKYDTFLLQQPEVHLHPRAQAEIGTLLAQAVRQDANSTMVVETHSDYIVDRIKIEIAQGRLDPHKVTILLFEREQHSSTATNIYFDKAGQIIEPPLGYRTFFMEEHAKLLGL